MGVRGSSNREGCNEWIYVWMKIEEQHMVTNRETQWLVCSKMFGLCTVTEYCHE